MVRPTLAFYVTACLLCYSYASLSILHRPQAIPTSGPKHCCTQHWSHLPAHCASLLSPTLKPPACALRLTAVTGALLSQVHCCHLLRTQLPVECPPSQRRAQSHRLTDACLAHCQCVSGSHVLPAPIKVKSEFNLFSHI